MERNFLKRLFQPQPNDEGRASATAVAVEERASGLERVLIDEGVFSPDVDGLIAGSTPAARAVKILGYHAGSQPEGVSPHALRAVLAQQRTPVLTDTSVSRYKDSVRLASARAYGTVRGLGQLVMNLTNVHWRERPGLALAFRECGGPRAGGLAASITERDLRDFEYSAANWTVPGMRARTEAWFQELAYSYPLLRWEETPLNEYGEHVPDEALATALRIKECLEEVSFKVEHTTVDKVVTLVGTTWNEEAEVCQTVMRPDPFLVAVHGTERYYIGYWDEHGYVPDWFSKG